jgi:schlafen family protein
MAVTTQAELVLALERGQFDQVLNTAESAWIEFKESAYILQQPYQKWELAKDVAAFANSQGGVIVLGYRTQRPENALVDTANEHRPVPKAMINWDAYRQTIASWVHPHLDGLTAHWFPGDPAVDRAVFVLIVPPQREERKYFVVRELDRPDGTFPGAFGVPIRQGDAVSWLRPEILHDLVREALGVRRGGSFLPAAIDHAQLVQNEQARVEVRCSQIEALADWADVPFVALHAIPSEPIVRPEDFYTGTGLRRALEQPDVLRDAGFHVRTDAPVEVQPDGALATASWRRALWLSPDGSLSAAASANSDFLGWYFNDGDARPIAINPRVLTEFTFEFSRFFHRNLRPRHAGRWHLWLSLVGLDRDGGVVMVPILGRGGDTARFWRGAVFEQRGPLRATVHTRLESTNSPESDAYRLLVEFYALFGFPPGEIPFVEGGSISEARLLAAMGQ